MALPRTATRADLTYLRRRPKREAAVPAAPSAPAPSAPSPAAPGSLNLTPPGAAPAAGGLNLTPPGAAAPAPPAATPPAPASGGGLSLTPPGAAPSSGGGLNLTPPGAAPASGGGLNLTPPGAASPPPAQPTAPSKPSLSHPGRPPLGGTPAATPASGAPSGTSSLNLSAPAPAAAPPSAPAASLGTSSLNLSPPPAAAPAAPAAPASTPGTSSLSLGGHAQPAVREAPPKPPSRRVAGRVLLSPDEPTVTLDRRQSAIGSLGFEIAGPGAVSAIWELHDGTAGLVDEVERVRISPEFGRRPIVELHQTHVVVGLRHVQQIRRLLILMSGFAGDQSQRLLATLHDSATFESTHTGVGPYVAALAIYHVDGELVVRREGFGFDSANAVAKAYGFDLNWLPPVHRPG